MYFHLFLQIPSISLKEWGLILGCDQTMNWTKVFNNNVLNIMVVFELIAKTNKRPTGHCTHLRKSFKQDKLQENYVDTPTLIKKKRKLSPFLERKGSFSVKTWIYFTQRCSVLRLIIIGPVVLKKKIFRIFTMF